MKIFGYVIGVVIVVFLLILVVSNSRDPSDSDAISFAKKRVSESMKDPSSTEFRSVDFFPSTPNQKEEIYGFVCGSVNAKNSFGAYAGFNRFHMNISVSNNGRSATMSPPLIEDPADPLLLERFDSFWKENCRKNN
ncbi:MAG: hypothetical protein ACTH5W_15780 [Providencia sp.]|uniref:hypothetical protein n=1 Tax=Providencia sp. TaxID=589 RepID=UPI003F948ED8